jgi:ketosteroid isomerase-like protein
MVHTSRLTGTIPELKLNGVSMKSSQFAPLATLLLLVCGSLAAQSPDDLRIWGELREVEKEFSERSRTLGMNQGFLGALGESAVVFRGGPVDARSVFAPVNPEEATIATFESRANYIDFARAGDVGLTTGPYRFINIDGEEPGRAFGHIVTIWRKFDGQWRMVADMAVGVPGSLSLNVEADIAETQKAFSETAAPAQATGNSLASLQEAEERFVSSINFRGGRRAIARYGLESQRIYVPGMAPGIGVESGSMVYGAFLDDRMSISTVAYTPGGTFVSESGDVGYTYGTMSAEGSGFETSYLRYWRFTPGGEWRIAVEVLNPH